MKLINIEKRKTNDLELFQKTDRAKLTLYTCTPHPVTDISKRLIFIAQ